MMRNVSGEFFIFQQDSAPAHRAPDIVRLLELAMLLFHRICGHQTVVTSTQSTTRYGASSSSECISHGRVHNTEWTQAAFGARLARHGPDHHGQCNWWAARPSSCLCAGKGWTLWTNAVTFIKTLIIQQCDNKLFICDFVSISYDLQGSFMWF